MPELMKQFPQVRDLTMSADGDEIYFTVDSYKKEFSFIATMKRLDGKWSEPKSASFSGRFKDLEPALSPDGLRLFFASNRPLEGNEPKDMDIWYVERPDGTQSWATPINVGTPINTEENEYYPSVAKSGSLYFTGTGQGTKGEEDIFMCTLSDGGYSEPISLSDSINSPTYEFNAFVAPDESFLIFSSYGRPDDSGGGDLYISHRITNSTWSSAKNLGDGINSTKLDYCPFVDLKNLTLYFTSERSAIKAAYDRPLSATDINKKMHQLENGLGKIFMVSLREKPYFGVIRVE